MEKKLVSKSSNKSGLLASEIEICKSRRILILFSIENKPTLRKIQTLNGSPRLIQYEKDYCYATSIAEEFKFLTAFRKNYRYFWFHNLWIPFPSEEKAQKIPFNKYNLLNRIEEKINVFTPNIVLIHKGFVFTNYPAEFHDIISDLRESHLDIEMGIQGERRGYSMELLQVLDVVFPQHIYA